MEITIKLTSLAQLRGLECAVDMYADIECERRRDAGVVAVGGSNEEWSAADEEAYQGAQQIVKILKGAR